MNQVAKFKLSVEGLAVARGSRQVFSGLSFELGPRELAVVTGPNGTGKTTLLRTLAGLQLPAAGTVTVNDRPIERIRRDFSAPVAFQGHLEGLNKDLTVAENMTFYAQLYGGKAALERLARELRIEDCMGRQVRYLSAGQKKRAALGCLRARPAALWLLDEPLTNLDQRGVELVTEWLRSHLDSGGAAVVATHQAERLALGAAVAVEL